jgi:hypothetical protein
MPCPIFGNILRILNSLKGQYPGVIIYESCIVIETGFSKRVNQYKIFEFKIKVLKHEKRVNWSEEADELINVAFLTMNAPSHLFNVFFC